MARHVAARPPGPYFASRAAGAGAESGLTRPTAASGTCAFFGLGAGEYSSVSRGFQSGSNSWLVYQYLSSYACVWLTSWNVSAGNNKNKIKTVSHCFTKTLAGNWNIRIRITPSRLLRIWV